MSTIKCNSCGATYSPTQPDGSRYFHVCSPEIITNTTFNADGTVNTPEIRTPRADIRNENLTGIDPGTGEPTIVSAGLGVTEV